VKILMLSGLDVRCSSSTYKLFYTRVTLFIHHHHHHPPRRLTLLFSLTLASSTTMMVR
jgi:hypothetical protein